MSVLLSWNANELSRFVHVQSVALLNFRLELFKPPSKNLYYDESESNSIVCLAIEYLFDFINRL